MTVPKEMRAARIVEVLANDLQGSNFQVNKPYAIQTIPVPEPKGTDILVKVGAASFCHTDALALDGSWPCPKPITGSHEGCGTVAKIGPDVPKGSYKVGDRVGLHPFYHVCGIVRLSALLTIGECHVCKRGGIGPMFCKNKGGALGLGGSDGSFAEYVITDSEFTVPIPENVSFADTVSSSRK